MFESPFRIDEFERSPEDALVDSTYRHRDGQSGSSVIMDPHPDGATPGHATQVAIFSSAQSRNHLGSEVAKAVRITKLRYLLIKDITN